MCVCIAAYMVTSSKQCIDFSYFEFFSDFRRPIILSSLDIE